jgi:metal-sulfur cluster biosynthetic enzyme
MIAERTRVTDEAVLAALGTVRDPELDEDLVSLGFVTSVAVSEDGVVEVRLRLPTYFCAPNFAFLMAADAHTALAALPGVEPRILLEDHYASEEINGGLADGRDFDGSFSEAADGNGLDDLRALFRRKAFLARQQRLCETLLAAGRTSEELAALSLAELPVCPELTAYLARRAELGLDVFPSAPFVVTPAGEPVGPDRIAHQLRIGRTVRVSIDGNAGICRGLLETRYGTGRRSA